MTLGVQLSKKEGCRTKKMKVNYRSGCKPEKRGAVSSINVFFRN